MEDVEWVGFLGDDDCEDCSGWDGYEQRCECGNRRVTWECMNSDCTCKMDDDFRNCVNAYAEAW